MKANFNRCMEQVFAFEGGLSNDPDDPGGLTNYGISQRSYPKEDIRGMTKARATAIYRRDYWNAVRGDDLPAGLDLVAFDAAVNSGVSRGAGWLQAALGVEVDGRIGPVTLARANAAPIPGVIERATDLRMDFLRGRSTWRKHGRGWQARVDAVERLALDMASDSPAPSFWAALAAFFTRLFRRTK